MLTEEQHAAFRRAAGAVFSQAPCCLLTRCDPEKLHLAQCGTSSVDPDRFAPSMHTGEVLSDMLAHHFAAPAGVSSSAPAPCTDSNTRRCSLAGAATTAATTASDGATSASAAALSPYHDTLRVVVELLAVAARGCAACRAQLDALRPFLEGVIPVPPPLIAAPAQGAEEGVSQSDRHAEGLVSSATAVAPLSHTEHERIAVAFNGGKDSVVMLHMLLSVFPLAAVRTHFYFWVHTTAAEGGEFEELRSFREALMAALELKFEAVAAPDIKSALTIVAGRITPQHTSHDDAPPPVVVLGSRRSDSAYQKHSTCETTPGWPRMLRQSPLFDWPCGAVWIYILRLGVPRCRLYDEGYTSLGPRAVTVKHEGLLKEACLLAASTTSTGGVGVSSHAAGDAPSSTSVSPNSTKPVVCPDYYPAWELHNDTLERSNRFCANATDASPSPPAGARMSPVSKH
jgi:FAD synthetase